MTPIRKIVVFAVFCIWCFSSSCVTMFCRQQTSIQIKAERGSKLVYDCKNYSSFSYERLSPGRNDCGEYDIPQKGIFIEVPRNKTKVLPVTIKKGNTEKTIHLHPTHASLYYFNVLSYGLGFLLDYKNPNRFGYPHHLYINGDKTDKTYHRFAPAEPRRFTLNLSIPYANSFYINDGVNGYGNGGFWGISAGTNYYYNPLHFISAQAGAAVNIPIPVPAPLDRFGDTIDRTNISSLFINVKNNHIIKRFDIGYGLSISSNKRNIYRDIRTNHEYQTTYLYSYNDLALGLALSGYYRVSRHFYAGINYQPYILSMGSNTGARYEHTIMLDLMWRIAMN